MADSKISDLAALAGADAATGDLIEVVDVSATLNKKMTLVEHAKALLGSTLTSLGDILFRGTNTLEQRNSTNAQTFSIYNTYTDGSNYERGRLWWGSNVLKIEADAAGTGTQRTVRLGTQGTTGSVSCGVSGVSLTQPDATNEIYFRDTGFFPAAPVGLGLTGAPFSNAFLTGYIEVVEMAAPSAPAANKARLFVQDNGAGKTQLMVLFPSGAAQQVAIEP